MLRHAALVVVPVFAQVALPEAAGYAHALRRLHPLRCRRAHPSGPRLFLLCKGRVLAATQPLWLSFLVCYSVTS